MGMEVELRLSLSRDRELPLLGFQILLYNTQIKIKGSNASQESLEMKSYLGKKSIADKHPVLRPLSARFTIGR